MNTATGRVEWRKVVATVLATAANTALSAFAGARLVYDAGDYVQDGLVGHFDAIRNAGADRPHDHAATVWKNLVPGQPDATIVGGIDADGAGRWTGNGSGFYFNGEQTGSYAQIDSPGIELGAYSTVQIVGDIKYARQTGSYQGIFHAGSGNDDTYSISVNSSGTVSFKHDSFSGGNATRNTCSSWNGKYLTAVLSENKAYLTDDSSYKNGKDRKPSDVAAVPAKTFTWGGSPHTWETEKRKITGVYNSVRLYNRALTEAELAHNKAIDEYRFNDGSVLADDDPMDVWVASNVLGLEGVEPSGKYIVEGSHTFTAVEVETADGNVYEPAGRKIEIYDSASQTWSVPETSDSNSYTYEKSGSGTDAKVRLTWNWRLKSGVKKYDADDYVQAGLILHFDGIRNAGRASPHGEAAKWRNLAAGNDATVKTFNSGKPGKWADAGYDFNGGDCFQTDSAVPFGKQTTVQIVSDFNESFQASAYLNLFAVGDVNEDLFAIYHATAEYNAALAWSGIIHLKANGASNSMHLWDGRFLNVVCCGANTLITDGVDFTMDGATDYSNAIGDHVCCIGAGWASDGNRSHRAFTGRIHAIRLYDRILAPAELLHNREIDRARFFDTAGHSTETDLVEVRSESPGGAVSLAEEGCYLVRGTGELAVSAPAATNIGYCAYVCTGYRLETWNAEKRMWENPSVVENATSATLGGTSGSANRRITWLWALSAGLRAAGDYGTDDYVQQGLVAHYDAIMNLGAGNASHASKAMYWRDCSYRDSAMCSALGSAHAMWTENSFNFTYENASCMRMTEGVELGAEFTIQAVVDADSTQQEASWPCWFGTYYDQACYGKGSLSLKFDNWRTGGSGRQSINPWAGKYVNLVATASGASFRQDSTLSFANWKYNIPAMYWTIGAPDQKNSANDVKVRSAEGNYHAARFYNRALTAAELAQNMKVDEIRYRGNFANYANLTVVNGQIGSTGTEGESSVKSGLYELTGAWTFTAPEMRVDGSRYYPSYSVEEYSGSAWQTVATGKGGECTVASGAEPLRLTWRWHRTGFMLVIH